MPNLSARIVCPRFSCMRMIEPGRAKRLRFAEIWSQRAPSASLHRRPLTEPGFSRPKIDRSAIVWEILEKAFWFYSTKRTPRGLVARRGLSPSIAVPR